MLHRLLIAHGEATPFVAAVSVLGPVVVAIIVLTLFFKLVFWMSGKSNVGPTAIVLKGILDGKTHALVHLTNGTSLENVRFIGFTNTASHQEQFPYEFHGMVILEYPDGRRVMIKARMIRMIEVPPKSS